MRLRFRRFAGRAAALMLLAVCSQANAQFSELLGDPDKEWKEGTVAPPRAFDLKKLVPLEAVSGSTLKFGVDPASVVVAPEGVVRFVVVATNAEGAINAFYEGIRCVTAQFKVYARYHPGGGWTMDEKAEWKKLHDVRGHALMIARSGACLGDGPNRSAEQVVRDLGRNSNEKFEIQFR